MVRRVLAFTLAVSLVGGALTGCGDGPTALSPPPTEPAPTLPGLPTGAEAVVVRIETGGGLVPETVSLAQVPQLSIYGDGTALTLVDGDDDQPNPVPTFERSRVELEGLQEVIAEADRDDALDEGVDLDNPSVTDLSTTSVEIATGEGRAEVSAYALGYRDVEDELPARTRRGREQLRDFIDEVEGLLGEDRQRWEPDRYEVVVRTETVVDDALRPPWPVGDLEAAEPLDRGRYRCLVLAGPAAAELDELVDRDGITNGMEWSTRSGDVETVVARPLLPDQAGCQRR